METETQFAFDISIFDRIYALFSSPFICCTTACNDHDVYDELSCKSQRLVQPKSEIKILSENLKLVLVSESFFLVGTSKEKSYHKQISLVLSDS